MNKILLGIDFSDCSINAFEHALTIADKSKSQVRLVWVNKPESIKECFEEEPENLIEAVNQKFIDLISKYKSGVEKLNIDFIIREGKVYREIVNAAEEWGSDLIIIGTHGKSGFEEFWMGSNAFKVVSATRIPVITIRGGVDVGRELKKIVLPVDSSVETRHKVPYTTRLAELFDAEIHVLAVYTSSVAEIVLKVDRYSAQTLQYLEEEQAKVVFKEVNTDNLSQAIINYAIEIDANLISIMREQEKATKNLWLGPYAAQIVNHSPIPVLSLHSRD
jgi:nucleotide-binding universal stress UspA family protein